MLKDISYTALKMRFSKRLARFIDRGKNKPMATRILIVVKIQYSIDGNQVCATFDNFINLQESPAGFGDSLKKAFLALLTEIAENGTIFSINEDFKEWEKPWSYEFYSVDPFGVEVSEKQGES